MKILKLYAENIKKLKVVEITPEGNLVQITGANAQGKSSVLDSIMWALRGAKDLPSMPVRVGEDRAVVKLDLGEVIVTRKFTAEGGTSLVVEAANGSRFASPQKLLDSLLGTLTFDPLAFTRMPPKQQLETIKGMVKLDVDVDALDQANLADYEKRTEVNRKVKTLEAQFGAFVLPEEVDSLHKVDVAAKVKELEAAISHNQAVGALRDSRQRFQYIHNTRREEANQLREKLKKVEALIEEEVEQMAGWSLLPELKDTVAPTEQISRANEINTLVNKRELRAQVNNDLTAAREESEALTQAMAQRLREKEEAISRAKMPISGLTFGDGEVMYNGVPFTQVSQAEQLCISTIIAMALNPKLRVIRIQDGSLLDKANLALLGKMAEQGDYQVWIERVESSDPCAIHLREGEVVANAQ